MDEMRSVPLAAQVASEMRAAFQEGHDRGWDRRVRFEQPQGGMDWLSCRARVRGRELESRVAALQERLRLAEETLDILERVRCAYCGAWAHVDDVMEECGKPYCADCYESWMLECDNPECSWRRPQPIGDADACPECGGNFIPVEAKKQQRQATQGENAQ